MRIDMSAELKHLKKEFRVLGKVGNKSVRAWYGTNSNFESWDITKTKEFGYHFSLDNYFSALQRVTHSTGSVIEVELQYSNSLFAKDPFHWNLETILNILGKSGIYSSLKRSAAISARENGTSLRVEENLIARATLNGMGYDAIQYLNLGENGGTAVVIWNEDQIKTVKA